MSDCIVGLRLRVMALIFLFLSIFLSFPILHVNIKNLCWGFLRIFFKARMLKLGITMDNELLYYGIEIRTPCSYSSLYLSIFYAVFFVFVFRLLRICVTVFFATYLLLLIYSSVLLKQCSGAIVRFSDKSDFLERSVILFPEQYLCNSRNSHRYIDGAALSEKSSMVVSFFISFFCTQHITIHHCVRFNNVFNYKFYRTISL